MELRLLYWATTSGASGWELWCQGWSEWRVKIEEEEGLHIP